jgi:hypothetical protein
LSASTSEVMPPLWTNSKAKVMKIELLYVSFSGWQSRNLERNPC